MADDPLAEAAIAKDLEEEPDHDPENPKDGNFSTDESDSDDSTIRPGPAGTSPRVSMVESYRKPTFTPAGPRATAVTGRESFSRNPTKRERHEARKEERSLLRDNNIIPPNRPQKPRRSESGSVWSRHFSSTSIDGEHDGQLDGQLDGSFARPSAVDPLLENPGFPYGSQDDPKNLSKTWEEAVMAGRIRTTWQRETKVLAGYSAPLVLTFLLQFSLTGASVFAVGHLGKAELGAVSLASMTANITGYAIYQGLATSLDTLCAQAYGSGRKTLVGLQTQRMVSH